MKRFPFFIRIRYLDNNAYLENGYIHLSLVQFRNKKVLQLGENTFTENLTC